MQLLGIGGLPGIQFLLTVSSYGSKLSSAVIVKLEATFIGLVIDMCEKVVLLGLQNKQGKFVMYFDEKFAGQHPWEKDWLVPQFNDPRLHGDELVNECDLFMLLRNLGHKEKIDHLERTVENISKLEIEVKRLIKIRGETEHLLMCLKINQQLQPLMAKRQKYIDKLRPEVKG